MTPVQLLFWLLSSLLLCFSHAKVPALFVFGDSVLDAGTNAFFKNSSAESSYSPPYGGSYFGYPTGRYSDGRTIADFLSQSLGLPLVHPFLKPGVSFKHGANFASSGSCLLGSTIKNQEYVSIKAQLEQFDELLCLRKIELGEDLANAWVNSSVFLVAIGTNDIRDFFSNSSAGFTRHQFVTVLMDRYKTLLLRLYEAGARKIVVLGLAPLGCTPFARLIASRATRRLGCFDPANELAASFNSALRQLTYSFNRNYYLQMVLAKPYDLLLGVMAAPRRFGFVRSELACCPCCGAALCGFPACREPGRFLFWDAAHLTEAADYFLLKNFWSGGFKAIEPYNVFKLTS